MVLQFGEIDRLALSEANKRWRRALGLSSDPIRLEDLGDGLLQLRAEAVTGVVRVGRADIEIAPKFLSVEEGSWQTVLWRILSVVEGGHIDDSLTSAHDLSEFSLPDLLAEIFLSSFARGAARGLPRAYMAEAGTGPVLRGSLDLSRLDRWLSRPWELPYVADLLTDNTPLAQLLRWAAECLAATVKQRGRARAVREVAAGLSHVGSKPPHLLDAQKISLGPQHQGLDAARIVGILLLEGAGVHHAGGQHALSGFLWKSDVIYENYVYWLCGRAASRRAQRVAKRVVRFGEPVSGNGSRLETTPDVVFQDRNGKVTAVADAKYKLFGSRPKAPDTYQVITAGHVLGCQRVSLTYPVAESRDPAVWRVRSALGGDEIELTTLPLNLMCLTKPDGSKALIDTISNWLNHEPFESEPDDAGLGQSRPSADLHQEV